MLISQEQHAESFETDGMLSHYVIQVPTVPAHADGQTVKDLFDRYPEAEGMVVMENGSPAGILMRTTFYQKIGSLYGHSLYMNRPISIIIDTAIMKVDVGENIGKIGMQAMGREQSKLYDYIVVYRNKTYLGVISIRLFLMELSKRNEAQISVLKQQQQELLNAHEQEILLRTDLEYQSASVRNLLDHADQGFLWFGRDLKVKREYSYKCKHIFQKGIAGAYFPDLISGYFSDGGDSVFLAAFDSYFKNNSPVTDNVYLMLLPSDCVILGKSIRFEYRRIESAGEKAVMVILSDITEKVRLEKAMEEDRNKQRLIIKACACQGQIRQMLDEFREILTGGYRSFFRDDLPFHDSLNELFRAIHTFKGDFAQYGFVSAAAHLHGFEDRLLSLVEAGEAASLPEVERIMSEANPDEMLEADLNVIYEVWGRSYFEQSELISVPKSRLNELERQIRTGCADPDAAASLLHSLQLKNVKGMLEQYRDYLEYLSGRVMKQMPVYLVEGEDVELDPAEYSDFFKSLVHIFRNSMDHGLESDEERLESGKSERGLVECQISKQDDGWFTLRISDDGRGIDLEKLKEKAAETKVYPQEELEQMSESELCSLIFADRLSTKDTADSLSGRGMGMSAVQEACLRLGGKLAITTARNQGTSFCFTLPATRLF